MIVTDGLSIRNSVRARVLSYICRQRLELAQRMVVAAGSWLGFSLHLVSWLLCVVPLPGLVWVSSQRGCLKAVYFSAAQGSRARVPAHQEEGALAVLKSYSIS